MFAEAEGEDFEGDFAGEGVAQVMFEFEKLFEEGEEMGLIGEVSEGEEGLFFFRAEFGLGFGGGDLEKEEVAEVAGEVLGDAKGIAVAGTKFVEFGEGRGSIACEDGGGEGTGFDGAGEAEDFEDVFEGDGATREADELFEGGFGIAQAALGLAGEKDEGLIGYGNFLGLGDFAEVGDDERIGDTAEVEALAAGEDGGGEFLDFGGGEDKFYVSGRFFEGFEEGVKGFVGEHVDFVDDIDFEFSAGGGVGNAVAEFFDAFDSAIGGAIDLENVEAATFFDLFADIVVGIEIGFGALGAVEGFGEDAGGGGFTDAAGTDEKKGVGEAAFGDGVGERADDVILADEFGKGARAVFASEDEVTHEGTTLRKEAVWARTGGQ